MRENTTGTIIQNWKPEFADMFGKQAMHLQHSLHKSELFSDEKLTKLIETAGRGHYHVNTRAAGPDGKKRRREGEFGSLTGTEILEAVRTGDIWINLRAPQVSDPAYGDLLEDMYAEFERRVPGLKTFKHITTILISSPNVYVPYHCDVPGQMLWQIRGRNGRSAMPQTPRSMGLTVLAARPAALRPDRGRDLAGSSAQASAPVEARSTAHPLVTQRPGQRLHRA